MFQAADSYFLRFCHSKCYQVFQAIICCLAIILENGTKLYNGAYSISFSTTNIILCFVFLSVKRMEPGFSSNSMFFILILLSIIEPAVKEEMYICIKMYVDR